jgi:hypothetical protein
MRRDQDAGAGLARATIVCRIRRMPTGSSPVSGSSNKSVEAPDQTARNRHFLPHPRDNSPGSERSLPVNSAPRSAPGPVVEVATL